MTSFVREESRLDSRHALGVVYKERKLSLLNKIAVLRIWKGLFVDSLEEGDLRGADEVPRVKGVSVNVLG